MKGSLKANKYDHKPGAGPTIGSLLAIAFYKFIKLMEYEMANPGQDADIVNDPTVNPYHNIRERQRLVTERVLKSLGYDANPSPFGDERFESLGSIKLYHKKSPSTFSAYPGAAPAFGPLGTPIRRSEDDAYRGGPGRGVEGAEDLGTERHR
jgi:hypothetical protein